MKKTDFSYISKDKETFTKHFMVEYSEEENVRNIINAENSKLALRIKYLTVPTEIFRIGLNGNEAIIFAFINSWLSEEENQRFYFTNDQLGKIFNINESTVSKILKRLKNRGLINLGYRKTAIGTYRFVYLATSKNYKSALVKSISAHQQKGKGTNNDIYDKNNGSKNQIKKEEKTIQYKQVEDLPEFKNIL